MKAYVGCVGCEQRQLDAARIEAFLGANGVEVVRTPESTDLIVLVTCAVDERNEEDSLSALSEILTKKAPLTPVFVGGCLPSISPDRLAPHDLAGTFSPRTLDDLDDILGIPVHVPMHTIPDPVATPIVARGRHGPLEPVLDSRREFDQAKRGFKLRINHGCLLSCSYCVIRLATGQLESLPLSDLVSSFREAARGREPTVMVLGGDTGAYGLDIGTSFPRLLHELLRVQGAPRIFVHDLNINWLIKDLPRYLQVLSEGHEALRAMTLPIQSGSDAVLKRMQRPYRRSAVQEGWQRLREAAPQVSLGTHIIAGFPGETELEFQETLDLLETLQPNFVTCFRFSSHPRAPAAALSGQVPEATKLERLRRLRAALGSRATVLV